MNTQDYQAELKAAQAKVKELGLKREQLVGDERVEASKVEQMLAKLKDLGVDASTMDLAALRKMQAEEQEKLSSGMATLQSQIAQAEAVLAEYEKVKE